MIANRHTSRRTRQHGIVSVLAMMFLVIFGSLAAAMAIVAQGNLRTAESYRRVNRSIAAAETGVYFASYRIDEITRNITTTKGTIDEALAEQVWQALKDELVSQMSSELHSLEPATYTDQQVVLGRVRVGDEDNAPTFRVILDHHPIVGENYDDAFYQKAPYNAAAGNNDFTDDGEAVTAANPINNRWVRMRVIGEDAGYSRTVQMDFRIDKRVRFAILSRNRVMIGRNVIIEGPIGSAFTRTDVPHGHPVQIRDDFRGLDATLDTWLDSLTDYLAVNDGDGDNRVDLSDDAEAAALTDAASYDRDADGYVDSYDFFLLRYDANSDGVLAAAEFQNSGGAFIDAQLWQMINEAKYVSGTQFDWVNKRVLPPGGVWTDAAADMNTINAYDNYAKIRGQIVMKAMVESWEAGSAAGPYQQYLRGPIHPDTDYDPLTFSATDAMLPPLGPGDFDVSDYRAMATGDFAAQVASNIAAAAGASQLPPSSATRETVPFGSPHPYDYYDRPVYQNMTFTNVKIPTGTNALFVNCKFVGATFVDTVIDNTDPNFNFVGMQEADGSYKYLNSTAVVNGTAVNDTKPHSNNIRFHDCTFEGMVAAEAPQHYSHIRNKLSFTGETVFDLQAASLTSQQRQTFRKSTIFTPQYSIDIGTFTNPTDAGEYTQLDGTIVAGVLDIRGQARIDGTVITTYDPVPGQGGLAEGSNPAALNTTFGYFESSSGDGEAEIPTGGYGKIIVRYDPYRALPDGISGPVELRRSMATYVER